MTLRKQYFIYVNLKLFLSNVSANVIIAFKCAFNNFKEIFECFQVYFNIMTCILIN